MFSMPQSTSTHRSGSGLDSGSPRVVERKVEALLNELTMERFDSTSDQIIAWVNKPEKEKDGRVIYQVIELVFEKAIDNETLSEMYARLCRVMMEQISPMIQDDSIKNLEGKPFAGGSLFRKYLINRCQEDFERGWVAKEEAAAAAATKATADQAVKEANEEGEALGGGESELYSDEYYAAAKARRRGLGLIRFIGELFKLQMLTERIMHECIKKLLGNVENPEEEEIESLCKLLTTVGSVLDTPKARAHLDVYFSRMRELTKNKNLNVRTIFILQDVIELRERKWVPRNEIAAPSSIARIHEAAAKEELAQEKDTFMWQNASMSHGRSRHDDDRNVANAPHPDVPARSDATAGPPTSKSRRPSGRKPMKSHSLITTPLSANTDTLANVEVWCLLIDHTHKPSFGEPFPVSINQDDRIHELKMKICGKSIRLDHIAPNEIEIWKSKSSRLSANDSFIQTKRQLGDVRFSDDENDDVQRLGVAQTVMDLRVDDNELWLAVVPRSA